jgi:hypothetical protein
MGRGASGTFPAGASASSLQIPRMVIAGDKSFADALSHASCRVRLAGTVVSIKKVGIYFSAAVLILKDSGRPGGIVVTKTLAKLTFGIAALAAATWFGTSSSRAYGDAPWCAVKTLSGDVYWNCQYRTVEECTPNVIAGDRGFCALNPWPGPSQVVPHKYQYQKRYAR